LKQALLDRRRSWLKVIADTLHAAGTKALNDLHDTFNKFSADLQQKIESHDHKKLQQQLELLANLTRDHPNTDEGKLKKVGEVETIFFLIQSCNCIVSDDELERLDKLGNEWDRFQLTLAEARVMLEQKKADMKRDLEGELSQFVQVVFVCFL
jgi:hypothetical protein